MADLTSRLSDAAASPTVAALEGEANGASRDASPAPPPMRPRWKDELPSAPSDSEPATPPAENHAPVKIAENSACIAWESDRGKWCVFDVRGEIHGWKRDRTAALQLAETLPGPPAETEKDKTT